MTSNAKTLVSLLREKNLSLSTCESMTAGGIANEITTISGSSEVFYGGFITYMVDSKCDILNIDKSFFLNNEVVSKNTAYIMAKKTIEKLGTDISLSVTGYAGPNDSNNNGHVCFAIIFHKSVYLFEEKFIGNRDDIRTKSIHFIIDELIKILRR